MKTPTTDCYSPFTVTIQTEQKSLTVSAAEPLLLSEALRLAGLSQDRPCGGHGKCGKCAVLADGSLSPLTSEERNALGEERLAAGWRLACIARATGPCTIHYNIEKAHLQGVIEGFSEKSEENFSFCPSAGMRGTGLAVDIGTTTVAAYLYDLQNGTLLGSTCRENPQRAHGADVISRIEYAGAGGLLQLQSEILACIDTMETDLLGGRDKPIRRVLTGNTTMLCLATAADPSPLAAAPFAVPRYFGETVGNTHYPRCISAYVGADITTALLAAGMYRHNETALLVDVGTNGEMVLCHEGKLLCCSTAAGPAFEGAGISCGSMALAGAVSRVTLHGDLLSFETIDGAAPIGLCGTGLIDAVACLLARGDIAESGRVKADIPLGDTGLTLTRGDVRQMQLAKSAIRSGIDTLLEVAGVKEEDVQTFYLAGGFGSYLHPETCAAIGLFPASFVPKIRVLGNAAGRGACEILLSADAQEEALRLAKSAETLDLSASPVFMEKYVDNMFFPAL